MLMGRIEPELNWSAFVTIRLLRRWVATRDRDEAPLPNLVELGTNLGVSVGAAVALGSLFQLTEGCLGRKLQAECCCSEVISSDERAVLLMLAIAPAPGSRGASSQIPHGLPGALAWAITSVRRLLGDREYRLLAGTPARCPFAMPSRLSGS